MTNHEDHTFERELHDVIERSVGNLYAPVPQLLAESRDRGRRLVRARHRTSIAGAVAAAAAVAVVAVVLPFGLRAASPEVAEGTQGGQSAGQPTPSAVGRELYAVTSVTAPTLSARLSLLAPQGVFVLDPVVLGKVNDSGYASTRAVVFRPGGATGQIRVTQTADAAVPTCPGTPVPDATCRSLTDTGGSAVGTRSTTTYGALTINRVEMVLREAGGSTTVTVANSGADGPLGPRSAPDGDRPPLTLDELVQMVAAGTDTLLQP